MGVGWEPPLGGIGALPGTPPYSRREHPYLSHCLWNDQNDAYVHKFMQWLNCIWLSLDLSFIIVRVLWSCSQVEVILED